MDSNLSLVILAAGSSTRYGLLKQTELFGNARLTIAEYNLLDAISCGVNHVVFVIKEQIADIFHKRLTQILPKNCTFSLVYQRSETTLNKFYHRTKLWGTGHAILSAKRCVKENFVVMNADDLYGDDAINTLIKTLKKIDKNSNIFSAVGYRLTDTLSDHGTVSRGIMNIINRKLNSITEHHGIQRINTKIIDTNNTILPDDTLVSMNLWGFTTQIFSILEDEWQNFIKNIQDSVNDEFYLPHAINNAIKNTRCTVEVLSTTSKWHGITYHNDRNILDNWLKNKKIV